MDVFDIIIDAYRIETLKPYQLGVGSGMSQYGWRIGAAGAGALALVVAARTDWSIAYMACSVFALPAMLTALIIPMLFGMFQLEKRGYLLLGSLALGGYTGIAAATAGMPGAPTLGVELMRVAVLASAILWTSLFSLHARRLRQCLQKQNRTLKTMLAEISELAERDELTKAYNRRYIMESLQEEKKRADRTRMALPGLPTRISSRPNSTPVRCALLSGSSR